MGFDDGQVLLDKPDRTYFAGDVIRGQLVFHQDKVKTLRGIYVRMKGFCNVHWTTSHTRRANNRTEYYTQNHNSYELYYKHKHYLIGNDSGEIHLQPGRHEFPFQFLIPSNCPSSYEGGNGHIRHDIKCVVDRALKFDQEKQVDVIVIARRDLNADPYCKEPMNFEFHESYCCWCVSAGICDISVYLPASGYCPRQVIPIEVSCENKSNVEIDTIKLELKEETTFRATHVPDTRHSKDVIAKIKKGPIPGNTTRKWDVEMEVPHMDVRNVDACKYIDVDYEFKVSIGTSGCHSDTSGSRRIVLGHIPLREFEGGAPPPTSIPNQPVVPLQQFPGDPIYQGANPYPGSQYPGGNPVASPYPGANLPQLGFIPPLGGDSPYPGPNPPYPGGNSPYPAGNSPCPAGNSPYPAGNSPYPAGNSPYPAGNSPYPAGNSPYPAGNSPFPGANPPPYPGNAPPYSVPTNGFTLPGPETKQPGLMPAPFLPPGAGVPYPNNPAPASPYAASAPEPATPDTDTKKPPLDTNSHPPPYSPDFSKDAKKPE